MQIKPLDYAKKRKLFIELLGGKCTICGSSERLEFDHIDPTKKEYNIAKVWANDAKVIPELKKCQLLCFEHHLEKTKREQSLSKQKRAHGKVSEYSRYKCRCALCTAAFSAWKKDYRKRKGITLNNGKKGVYGRPSQHGEELNYVRGCRCEICKKGHAEYSMKMKLQLREKRKSLQA